MQGKINVLHTKPLTNRVIYSTHASVSKYLVALSMFVINEHLI